MRRTVPAAVCLAALLSAGAGRASAAWLPAAGPVGVAQDDLAQTRALAQGGRRADALARLAARLDVNPGDLDARTLYGIVLSWDARYDDARRELTRVLEVEPTHGDALGALARVELWSGSDARAEELAGRVLATHPGDAGLLLVRATALHRLDRVSEALPLLDRALTLDPSLDAARRLRLAILDARRTWQAGTVVGQDRFDGSREPWHETGVFVGRDHPWGHTELTLSRARRFDRLDQQFELDVYRTLRPGSYVHLLGGVALARTLYPDVKWGAEYYRTIGSGLEGSLGYRYLRFGEGVDIYVASMGKYAGDWLVSARLFVVPDADGPARTIDLGFRRHFDTRQWIGVRMTQGVDWDDPRHVAAIQARSARGVAAEWVGRAGSAWEYTLRTSWDHRERASGGAMDHWSTRIRLARRFQSWTGRQ